MNSHRIRIEVSDSIGELILNKPERRNALSSDMWQAIPALVKQLVDNPDVKAIIIHGGTAGAFAAGADISEFETIYATPESAKHSADLISDAVTSLARCAKPVIAAIDGACVGGGVSVALAADIRVAGEGAKFAVTPAKLGLVYPVDDTRRLIEAVGVPAAKDILLTGRLFLSDEAFRLGLVSRLAAKGEALTTAKELAHQIGENSLWSHRATKRTFEAVKDGWHDDSPEAKALFLESFSNEDFAEGYSAFLAKRPAKFTFR
jgi:enoyl-CoA hydratase/carnithine racemase